MKTDRVQILNEINKVMTQVAALSVRVDSFDISSCGGNMIQLTIYDVWGNYIDCTIGTPYEVLCSAKLWLYPLLD